MRLSHRDTLPEHLRDAVIALGNFDGFHLGHQKVVPGPPLFQACVTRRLEFLEHLAAMRHRLAHGRQATTGLARLAEHVAAQVGDLP